MGLRPLQRRYGETPDSDHKRSFSIHAVFWGYQCCGAHGVGGGGAGARCECRVDLAGRKADSGGHRPQKRSRRQQLEQRRLQVQRLRRKLSLQPQIRVRSGRRVGGGGPGLRVAASAADADRLGLNVCDVSDSRGPSGGRDTVHPFHFDRLRGACRCDSGPADGACPRSRYQVGVAHGRRVSAAGALGRRM